MGMTVRLRRQPNDSIDSTRRAWTGFSNRCGSMMGRKAHLSLDEVSERLANQNSGSDLGSDGIGYMVQVWLRRSAIPVTLLTNHSRSWDFFCTVRVRDFLSNVE